MMKADTPILHHYAPSPFSEKVRKILAYKQLEWLSVETPPIMPKPDLIALTGGYRKAPVLQVGCDIYCDTKLISRVLDQLKPAPPLVAKGQEATTLMAERWVDQAFFFNAVALFFQPQGLAAFAKAVPEGMVERFLQDRADMFAQGGNLPGPSLETARAELPLALASIEAQLTSQPWLCGDAPGQIDFAVYTPVWFIHTNPGIAGELKAFPRIQAWADRIMALEGGQRTNLSAQAAIDICRETEDFRAALPGMALQLPEIALGDQVGVSASDYAVDQVRGKLLMANACELVIEREDARAGRLRVHFPAEGFSLSKLE